MDLHQFIEQFQDYLAPKLDIYEQAIYLYIFRHSRLLGLDEVTIGFKSARKRMALGIGQSGTPPSELVVYKKLRSLKEKGCIEILDSGRSGTKFHLKTPIEIQGCINQPEPILSLSLEEVDFFNVPENRTAILERENRKCFYCFRKLEQENYVIEHVVSRPVGNNSYRNVVAACRSCNNKKGSMAVEDYLRTLYRDGYFQEGEFEKRLENLVLLRDGELKPKISL